MPMSAEMVFLIPELVLLILACLILICDTFSSDPSRALTYWLTQFSLLAVMLLVIYLSPDEGVSVFHQSFILDPMSVLLKAAICLVTIVVFFYSYDYFKEHDRLRGEYFVLGLFAVLGMLVMVSAYSMLTVYMGLELMSLSLYAMVAMHKDSTDASEAAMKYFVLGALASGMLLYGMSILYGASGTLILPELAGFIAAQSQMSMLLVFGLVFVVAGIAFKLGAVPFHMWVPDVYEGAPTPVTLFIASAPKIAALAMAIRLLVDGMQPLHTDWQGMLIILALLSMATGNVIAIAQTNIKRMLAYSAIAHMGFLILGILPGIQPDIGSAHYASALFYVLVYALMSMGAFGMIILLGRRDYETDKLDDFKGLAERSPWFAFIMLILMFSLAGVPPFAGFWAKWFVIKEVVVIGHIWLAALAVIFSVIGAYYYLRIVKLMYFDQPEHMTAIKASKHMRMMISVNALVLLLLGFIPDQLMGVCTRVLGF